MAAATSSLSETTNLFDEHVLLLALQLVHLLGLDALRHELEVGVVLLAQLLDQARVLLLHVLERLARHLRIRPPRYY